MLKSDAKDLDNSAAEQVKRIVDHSDMEGAGKMYVDGKEDRRRGISTWRLNKWSLRFG